MTEDLTEQLSKLLKDLVIRRECGHGGFGQVYLATDNTLARDVAVKVVPKNHDDAYHYEYRGLVAYCSAIHSHPNLLTIHSAVQNDTLLAYTMELADNASTVPGEYIPDTLGYRLGHGCDMSLDDIHAVIHGILNGLRVLHGAGLTHHDIKPENVLFVDGSPKLADFSIMTRADDPLAGGTEDYTPHVRDPNWNSLQRGMDQDLYAVGKTLYAMFANRPVQDFPAISPAKLSSPIGQRLNQFLMFACANSPDERFMDVLDFRNEFNSCFDDTSFTHSWIFRIASLIFALGGMLFLLLLSSQ